MNYEFVDPVNEKLKCPICMFPFIDCVETNCPSKPHRFCKNCIKTWLKDQSSCPICRSSVSLDKLIPCTLAHEFLSELTILCPYGCSEKFKLGDLNQHLLSCKNSIVPSYDQEIDLRKTLVYRHWNHDSVINLSKKFIQNDLLFKCLHQEAIYMKNDKNENDLFMEIIFTTPKVNHDYIALALAYQITGNPICLDYFKKVEKHFFVQYCLGMLYYQGTYIAQDFKKALQYFLDSSKQGYFEASYMIGLIYEDGIGIQRDLKKSLEFYKNSMKEGYKKAEKKISYISDMYINLNIDQIRNIANYKGLKEAYFNLNDRVISYENSKGNRLNIYYKSGTVEICLPLSSNDQTELITINNSLDSLYKTMDYFVSSVGKGYYYKLKDPSPESIERSNVYKKRPGGCAGYYDDSDEEFLKNEITDRCISMTVIDGIIVGINENNSSFWNGKLPNQLFKELNNRRFKNLAPPIYISGGTNSRYFISYLDGSSSWEAPDDFGKIIKKSSSSVEIVAFGEQNDSFFIQFRDGSQYFSNLPNDVYNKIRSRNPKLPKLKNLTFGEDGQYALLWENGTINWFSHNKLDEIIYKSGGIWNVYFGKDGDAYCLS